MDCTVSVSGRAPGMNVTRALCQGASTSDCLNANDHIQRHCYLAFLSASYFPLCHSSNWQRFFQQITSAFEELLTTRERENDMDGEKGTEEKKSVRELLCLRWMCPSVLHTDLCGTYSENSDVKCLIYRVLAAKGPYNANSTFIVLLYVHMPSWHVSQPTNAWKKQFTLLVVIPRCQTRYG